MLPVAGAIRDDVSKFVAKKVIANTDLPQDHLKEIFHDLRKEAFVNIADFLDSWDIGKTLYYQYNF